MNGNVKSACSMKCKSCILTFCSPKTHNLDLLILTYGQMENTRNCRLLFRDPMLSSIPVLLKCHFSLEN